MFALRLNNLRLHLGAVFLFGTLLAAGPSQAYAAATATTTTLAITAGANAASSVASGTAVTLTATVKAGSVAVPAGQVKFCDAEATYCTDIHLIGIAQLTTAGTAALKFIPGPGIHSFKAEFVGTTADAASASVASPLTVNGAPTTTAISQSGNPGSYTLKATVISNGSATAPAGKVSFLDTSNGNAVLGTAELGTGASALTWTNPQSPATAADPQSIVVADFNGDGIPDIAVGTNGTSATKNIGSINLLLGNGDGTFQAAKTFTGLAGNQLIGATSFVTGGPQDILAVDNSSATTNNGLLFIGDGKGGLGTGTPFSLGIDTVTTLITGDFNGDGKQDFVVGGLAFGVPAFNVFLGNGNGTFNGGTLNATSDVAITALGAGDFTGQGALDLVVAHTDGTIDIFLQDGVGDFYPNAGTQAGSSPSAIAVGDFNGDGKADLAITNSGGDNVSILIGDGTGNFTAAASPNTGKTPASIALGDFNSDGIVDLAIANSGADNVTVLLGKGDGTFTAETPLTAGNTPVSLAPGRFNAENTTDLAVVNQNPGSTAPASTATILLAQLTQTVTATATGIAPSGAGTHLVDASYAGDDIFHTSVSPTTSISGTASQASAPIFSPAAGQYTAAQAVTLTDATSGAAIYYTTNGTSPTTASTKYTAAINVSTTTTIEAIAVATGYTNSIVASATYTITTPAPAVSLSPGTLAFASTTVGSTSATQTITLKNTGTAALTLTSETITGTNASSYLISANTCTATLAASATCAVSVAFKPAAAGTLAAALSVADNATGSPQTVALSGTGVASGTSGTLTVTPATLTFASTTVGSTTAAQQVIVKNTGTTTVTFSGFTYTGANTSSFVQSGINCGTTLAAGAVCAVAIEFKPVSAGALTATLNIADNATGSPQTVALSGTGVASGTSGTLTVTPASLTFASTTVGSTTAAQQVIVKNTGTTTVTFSGFTYTGTNTSSFVQSGINCGTTLASGAVCAVAIEFKPVSAGALTATLNIADNATGSPQTVALSGTGVASGTSGTLTVTPASLTFASTTVGSTTAAQQVIVKNTGTTTVTFSGFTYTGTNTSSFVQSGINCGTTLAAGAVCAVAIEFKPVSAGTLTATLNIADNATGSPQTVALSGAGVASGTSGTLTVTPASLTFASTTVGSTTAAQQVIVKNTGTTTVTFSGFTYTGTNISSFVQSGINCGTTLAAGAVCAVAIEFKPVSAGALTATLNIADNATGSPQTVALSGAGVGSGTPGTLTITPASHSLAFASTSVGSQSAAQQVVVKNTGTIPVTFTSFTNTGASASSFVQTDITCGSTLAAGSACAIAIAFKPQSTGALSATLNIADSATESPQQLTLTGTGK